MVMTECRGGRTRETIDAFTILYNLYHAPLLCKKMFATRAISCYLHHMAAPLDDQMNFVCTPEHKAALDILRRAEPDLPSRSEQLRRLIERAAVALNARKPLPRARNRVAITPGQP